MLPTSILAVGFDRCNHPGHTIEVPVSQSFLGRHHFVAELQLFASRRVDDESRVWFLRIELAGAVDFRQLPNSRPREPSLAVDWRDDAIESDREFPCATRGSICEP